MNQYISEVISQSIKKGLITIDDLYTKKESEIVNILNSNFSSWRIFSNSSYVSSSDQKVDGYSVSIDVKKRNVVPLVETNGVISRIDECSCEAKEIYDSIRLFQDKKYGYIKELKRVE